MSAKRPLPPKPLPPWLMTVASLSIAFHLLAVVVLFLSARSGPWPTPFGVFPADGPPFAERIASVTTSYYLRPLQMTHNYHFLGNRPDQTDIRFEVRLKDADGHVIKIVRFPSPQDNAWLRQRHAQLAQWLGNDEQIAPLQGGEEVAAPHQKAPSMKIWDASGEPLHLVYRDKEKHLLPKGQPMSRPNDWALILVRSYQRYLCRTHGAASAELVRYSRSAILPIALLAEQPPAGTFDTLQSTFEEYRRDH